ncbi:MAG: pyrroline-5-carboxylate reductase [Ruminococcaceae bacterium]|nr:pyrroline-5-carboxylate reductase [Oscillospiraceae bacterium]
MSRFKFGFLGCGNMGGALAMAASKVFSADQLAVCDTDPAKTALFVERKLATAVELSTLVAESDFLFLGVKPQALERVIESIRPMLEAKKEAVTLVSMAAGVEIFKLERWLEGDYPIIRIMPNTPVSVGQGMILYNGNEKVTESQYAAFLEGLSHAGRLDRLPEHLIDAAGSLSGCGPAFVYLFAEALADGGVTCGLPRERAMLYAAQTLLGAAEMLLQSGKHPGELKDAVCSPGGTTIAGVHALEKGGLRGAAMDAVIEAYNRTKQLTK